MSARADADRALLHQGHYAGPVTRLLAYLADVGIVSVLFAVASALVGAAITVATPWTIDVDQDGWWIGLIYLLWWFLYFWNSWALRARSPGMALLGLRIVRADGADLDVRRATIRLLAFPLGFLTLGIGFLGIIVGRTHQAIYDRIAHTAVVYGWDARATRLRTLAAERDHAAAPTEPGAESADGAAGPAPVLPERAHPSPPAATR